uniref:PAS domain-containing protein n=1 Tax=Amphiprion percula TaxID=161767 RepID=A0A3P8UBP2_AMPPE
HHCLFNSLKRILLNMVSNRSTKGASKARRDHINHEIRNMRALLPITQEDQERLSYLHSMAAICTYIRKSVLLQGLSAGDRSRCSLPYEAFLQALHGFILVTTAQGRLVYVSENVDEYLGLSMVDVLQGDTLGDMVERSDVDIVKSNLDFENNSSSGSFQFFHQRCPTDSHFCQSFFPDSFVFLFFSVLYFLGYSADELTGRSWYSLVHPEDLSLTADSHKSLSACTGFVEMVLRLQRTDLSWTWIYIRANKDSECQSISCTNFIISETEAEFLKKKISSDAFRPSSLPHSYHFTQQAPAFFTPPYSPASSSSSLPQDELSHDLLMDVHECTDQLLSSPESSPSYYSYPEAGLTCHQSPSDSLPVAPEQTFDQAAFGVLSAHSPLTSSSPTHDFQACTSDARLVPDCLSVSDMCESPVDCALHPDDFSLLEQPQGGSLVQLRHVPHKSNQYNEIEQAEISILAQQISTLASSFDMHHTLNPLTNLVLDDGVFDSILKDFDMSAHTDTVIGLNKKTQNRLQPVPSAPILLLLLLRLKPQL